MYKNFKEYMESDEYLIRVLTDVYEHLPLMTFKNGTAHWVDCLSQQFWGTVTLTGEFPGLIAAQVQCDQKHEFFLWEENRHRWNPCTAGQFYEVVNELWHRD